jgi:hypothetical protein
MVNLNDGTAFPPSGIVPRVSAGFSEFDTNGVCSQTFGSPEGLPEPVEGTIFIVSGMLLAACPERKDLVAPATGHPGAVRNEKGHIVSVPGFVR